MTSVTPRAGRVHLMSWGGSHHRLVTVFGQTRTRWRVLYENKPTGGREKRRASAWTAPMGSIGFVSKHAVTFACTMCDAQLRDIVQLQCDTCQRMIEHNSREAIRCILADARLRYANGKTLGLSLTEAAAGRNAAPLALLAVIDAISGAHYAAWPVADDRRWGDDVLKLALENA